ncbi:hypothetical protein ACFPYN_08925 [Paenisporosarcina macmurdoensis]|uniref:Uncharacterized protein n=1 Tax=Paenisporosarcina macmurdoensis TaxID=212659 RepID=A0ABW1L6E4_9BACL
MLGKQIEDDFEVLRAPLESWRQRPDALAGTLLLTIFLQALIISIEYFMIRDATIYPYKDEVLTIH